MGLSDEQKRKAKEQLASRPLRRPDSGVKKPSSGQRPVMSEEQKQKARELAKAKFDEKQKAQKEAAEKEAALKAEKKEEEWTSYTLGDGKDKQKSKSDSEMGKRGLTQKQKNTAIQVEQDFTKAEAMYEKAVGKYMRPDLDEALLLMRGALALHPSNSKYHYNIAYIYSVRGDDEICLNHYKAFLRYAPASDPDIKNVQARVKYYEKKIRESFEQNRHNKDKLF